MNTIALNREELAKRKRIRSLFTVLRFLLILIFFVIFLFPVYWIAVGAFKVEGEFYHYPPIFWPSHFDFQNFVRGLTTFGGAEALVASLVVALSNTILVIGFGVLLAYSMGRFKVGGDNMSFFVLSLLFAPPVNRNNAVVHHLEDAEAARHFPRSLSQLHPHQHAVCRLDHEGLF